MLRIAFAVQATSGDLVSWLMVHSFDVSLRRRPPSKPVTVDVRRAWTAGTASSFSLLAVYGWLPVQQLSRAGLDRADSGLGGKLAHDFGGIPCLF